MASIVRIKRSTTGGNPTVLGTGELAYSALPGSGDNGGERLYIGMGPETAGDAQYHYVIGGKFFTDMLDHSRGTLTANSAVVVDASGKVNEFYIDDLYFNDNVITTTISNANLVLDANGNGKVNISHAYSLPNVDGGAGYVLTSNNDGTTSWNAPAASSFTVTGDTGTDVFNTGQTLTFTGTDPIDTAVTDNTVTISVKDATTSVKGVASFDSGDFTVSTGAVSLHGSVVQSITVDGSATATPSGNSFSLLGGEGIDVTNAGAVITVAAEVATSTNLGVATFNTSDFSISGGGDVTLVGAVVKSVTTDSGAMTPSSNGFSILGGEGMDVTHSTTTITIAGEDATTTNKGIASFSSADFAVTTGEVTIKAGGVDNNQLANSTITLGSSTLTLGATTTSIAGLTELTIDNININGNEITSTNTNGNISLNPNGTGTVDVNGAVISNVGTPVNGNDAATKTYVDNAVTGLTWKQAVNLLSTTNVALTGTTGTLIIDGYPSLDQLDNGYRILLKGQTDPTENGIYVYNDLGSGGAGYTLTRSIDADTFAELKGAAVFVLEGTTYANTGWVQNDHYLTGFGGQDWTQFSGAGAYSAGDGLGQNGTEFFVKVNSTGGIEISADQLQLKSTVSGNGLTLTNGVLDVVGTANRITVNADSIDIASTYVGQSSIITLGTITTGTWNGTTIAVANGGTGLTTVTARAVVFGNGADPMGVTGVSAIDGSFLREDATGNPYWSNVIDGGTY